MSHVLSMNTACSGLYTGFLAGFRLWRYSTILSCYFINSAKCIL